MPPRSRWTKLLLAVACAPLLGGCSGSSPSTLDPEGPKASTVAGSWWLLLAVAGCVCLIVIVLSVVPALRRHHVTHGKQSDGMRVVLVCGVILPAIILASTFGLAVRDLVVTSSPDSSPQLTIDVVGHQWWWEARYPRADRHRQRDPHARRDDRPSRLTTATSSTASGCPRLPKMDLLPGQINETWLAATAPALPRPVRGVLRAAARPHGVRRRGRAPDGSPHGCAGTARTPQRPPTRCAARQGRVHGAPARLPHVRGTPPTGGWGRT